MLSQSALSNSGIFALPCQDFSSVAVAESHVLARYFSGIPRAIRSHGADADELIDMFHIDPCVFEEPEGQIDCALAMPLIEECSYRLDAPFLGIEVADNQSADSYGYVAALCRTAPDMRSALQAYAAYTPMTVSPEGMFEVLESKDCIELRWDCDSELRQNLQGNLHAATILIRLLRDVLGEDFQPICVNLPQVWLGKDAGRFSERMGCAVRFASRHYGSVVLPKDLADRPLPRSNRFAYSALERPLAEVKDRIEGEIAARVKAFVRAHMNSPTCTVEECASALVTSVRTLQKHLARRAPRSPTCSKPKNASWRRRRCCTPPCRSTSLPSSWAMPSNRPSVGHSAAGQASRLVTSGARLDAIERGAPFADA